jgi:hypothetical protein
MAESYRNAPPKASIMIEALRGLGYSTATALADIIDNSITARATQVDITFYWEGQNSRIAVLDDGDGMDEEQLDKAMRLGYLSPLDKRDEHDLGRYGLGLKTASFSQCRCLTVSTIKHNSVATLRWDLDVLAESSDDGWRLLEAASPGSEIYLSQLCEVQSGTIVLWEKLDRIITPGFSEQDFLDLIDAVERHLAMVFHRYLAKSHNNFSITINKKLIVPWDPFLLSHAATWSSPIQRLSYNGGYAEVQCFVLPHKDRLDTKTYENAAGIEGWTSQQGVYVYRNKRLLVSGGWLGLGQGRSWTREDSHRLARIRLDIPNTVDSDWKIDIRKSRARPPVAIKTELTRIADDVRQRARRVFAHRGQPYFHRKEPIQQAWMAKQLSGGIRYQLDESHPAISAVLNNAGKLHPQIQAMLHVIEETIPVQRIWLDTAEKKETAQTGFSAQPEEKVEKILQLLFDDLTQRCGLTASKAKQVLMQTEPFHNYQTLIANLVKD